jgi:hypothetical protein
MFVYRELLWIDGSNGLAHLYESDKAQPGRSHWYDRTVRFTNELQDRLGVSNRTELKAQLDRLFRDCLEKLMRAREEIQKMGKEIDLEELVEEATPGTDVEAYVPDADLVQEFTSLLVARASMSETEAVALAREMVKKARHFFTVERKRQNILGEGFEDLLFLLATKVSEIPKEVVLLRQKIDKLPGFGSVHARDRVESPDIAFVSDGRTDFLMSVKWSIRQDRQKQWSEELDCYADLLSQEEPKFLLVTNEYDPGRLINAFALKDRESLPLDTIYHVNLELLELALSDHPTYPAVKTMIETQRLKSLSDLLIEFQHLYAESAE